MELKTLEMITDSILRQVKPSITSDVDISRDWIDDVIDDSRAALVRALYSANDLFLGWHQSLDLKSHITKEIFVDGYSYKLRNPLSVIDLPGELMSSMGWKNILYIGPHGFGGSNIHRVTMSEFEMYEYHRFGNNTPCFTVVDNKIYLKNNGSMVYFKAEMCFAKPSCVPGYDRAVSKYPLPLSEHRKLEIITFNHIATKLGIPIDTVANNVDETKNASLNDAIKNSQRGGAE